MCVEYDVMVTPIVSRTMNAATASDFRRTAAREWCTMVRYLPISQRRGNTSFHGGILSNWWPAGRLGLSGAWLRRRFAYSQGTLRGRSLQLSDRADHCRNDGDGFKFATTDSFPAAMWPSHSTTRARRAPCLVLKTNADTTPGNSRKRCDFSQSGEFAALAVV